MVAAICACTRSGSTESTSEEFRILEKLRDIDTTRFHGRAAQDAIIDGDTLLVVSADTAGNDALQFISASTGDTLGSVDSWLVGTGTTPSKFSGAVTCLTATGDRIFVGTKDSRVEVFRKRPFGWETTVGTGVWWGNDTTRIVHSFGLGSVDSLLLVRDRSCLRAFPLSRMTYSNRNKIKLHCKSKELSTSTAHHGIAVLGGRIYVTDWGLKAILVFDRERLRMDSMEVLPTDTFHLPYAPLGITVHRDQLWVTGANGTFESRSSADGSLIRHYGNIEGHRFVSPGAIHSSGNGFVVVEQAAGSVVQGNIRYSTINIHP